VLTSTRSALAAFEICHGSLLVFNAETGFHISRSTNAPRKWRSSARCVAGTVTRPRSVVCARPYSGVRVGGVLGAGSSGAWTSPAMHGPQALRAARVEQLSEGITLCLATIPSSSSRSAAPNRSRPRPSTPNTREITSGGD
jgi:hypothetical protein